MPEDYYSLLGVDPDAAREAILRAYREQAAEHHPDVSDDPDAHDRFRRLNRAKQVLTEPDRRAAYDRLGHEGYVDRRASGERANAGGPPPSGGDTVRLDAMVERWLSALGGPWRAAGPAGTGWPDGPVSQSTRATVDLEWLAGAATEGPPADRRRECPRCHGRGSFLHVIDTARGRRRRVEPCERCGGAGSVAE